VGVWGCPPRVVSAGGSKNEEAGIESKVEEGVGYDNGVG
jgi:hypothetical protein